MIGKMLKLGVGIEGTRGTAVNPQRWIPLIDPPFISDKKTYVRDEAGYGVIAESVGADIMEEWSEGEIKGYVTETGIGYLLLAAMGQVSSSLVESGVYDHTFSLLNSNAHPSLTYNLKHDLEQRKFALGMTKSFSLSFERGKYAEFTNAIIAKKGVAATDSPSYATSERKFFSKMVAVAFAGSVNINPAKVTKVELSVEKNAEAQFLLGSNEPDDIENNTISIEGNIEGYFSDTDMKSIYENGYGESLTITLTHPDTIGAASHPTITITLPSVHLEEWEPSGSLGDQVMQTVKFSAKYNLATASLGSIVLRNTQATYAAA